MTEHNRSNIIDLNTSYHRENDNKCHRLQMCKNYKHLQLSSGKMTTSLFDAIMKWLNLEPAAVNKHQTNSNLTERTE